MKKIISLFLVSIMILFAFSGCGAKKEDWEYIEDKGTLKVGITIFKPMNYKDEATGEWTGFETEFTQAVADKLGVKVEFVEIDWKKKVVELDSRTIDLIWNGMTVTDELRENIDVSKSYMNNWQVTVIRKADAEKFTSLEAMKDAKTVAEAESAGEKAIKADDNLKSSNYVSVESQAKALMEIKAGTADVAVIDYVMAKASVGEGTDYSDLVFLEDVKLSYEEYAVGIRKGSTETVKKINDAIDALIADGTLNKIAEKYGVAAQLISNQKG